MAPSCEALQHQKTLQFENKPTKPDMNYLKIEMIGFCISKLIETETL